MVVGSKYQTSNLIGTIQSKFIYNSYTVLEIRRIQKGY